MNKLLIALAICFLMGCASLEKKCKEDGKVYVKAYKDKNDREVLAHCRAPKEKK